MNGMSTEVGVYFYEFGTILLFLLFFLGLRAIMLVAWSIGLLYEDVTLMQRLGRQNPAIVPRDCCAEAVVCK